MKGVDKQPLFCYNKTIKREQSQKKGSDEDDGLDAGDLRGVHGDAGGGQRGADSGMDRADGGGVITPSPKLAGRAWAARAAFQLLYNPCNFLFGSIGPHIADVIPESPYGGCYITPSLQRIYNACNT